MLLLVFADVVFGRDALTRVAAQPGTLMQGVLGMMLLAAVAGVVLWGDVPLGPVGAGSMRIAVLYLLAMRISSGFERRDVWRRVDEDDGEPDEDTDTERPLARMLMALAALAATILAAGALLARCWRYRRRASRSKPGCPPAWSVFCSSPWRRRCPS